MTATQEQEFVRQPPQNDPAEQAVLGGMMLSATALGEVVEVLRTEDFYRPAHRIIWDAMMRLFLAGSPVDPVSVMTELVQAEEIGRIPGGTPYLHDLIAMVPTAANAGYYAERVAEKAVLRRLVEAGVRITQLGYGTDADQGGTVAEAVSRAHIELDTVAHAISVGGPVLVDTMVGDAMDQIERFQDPGAAKPGVPVHLAELANLIPTLAPGSVTVVAGRPASAKSTFATNLAKATAFQHQIPTLLFSLEMSRWEIMQRILSDYAKINFTAMRTGTMSDEDWGRLARRAGEILDQTPPLAIDDTASQTPSQILATARKHKQRNPGLRLVVVDYAQLLTSGKAKVENRQVEVSEISRTTKLIAKELDVAVVLVAQLNRGPEARADKKPLPSDLRESGSLEADADNIILIHRPEMYDPDDRPGEADLIVAKHRNGPTGVVSVASQLHYCRLVDMAI